MSTQRYRTKAKYHETNLFRGYQSSNQTEPVFDTPLVPFLTSFEVMKDVVGNKDRFNPVSHMRLNQIPGKREPFRKEYLLQPPFLGTRTAYSFGEWVPWPWGTEYDALPALIQRYDDLEAPLLVLPTGEAASFTRQALDKALNQVPTEISIANFLWELREVKSLIPKLEGWKTIPNQFLNLSFGWIPFIQDIKALLTVVATVRKRLEHLKRVNKRAVTISHQKRYILVDSQSEQPTVNQDSDPSDNSLYVASKISYEEVTVRQHLIVGYDLDLSGADAFIQAMCSALGLMNPLAIIWEAIPFSFAVDWFIHLGSFLDEVGSTEPFKGTIAIRSAFCSAKTRQFVEHWSPTLFPYLGERKWDRYSTTLIRGYHRRSGTLEGTIEVTGLTPFQQALAAALIASNANFNLPSRRRGKRV